MPFIVRLFRVRGLIDFVVKLTALLFVIGGVNHLRDIVMDGAAHAGFWKNFGDGAFVGLPLAALGLLMMAHLLRLQTELEFFANHDPLTGLLNRRSFLQQAEVQLQQGPATLLILDLDHFKDINDTFGHDQGDACLIAVARFLKDHVRQADLIARLGGEEFGVLLPHTELDAALAIATRMADGFTFQPSAPAQARLITMSVGVAAAVGAGGLNALIKCADMAMYDAKASGRAQAKAYAQKRQIMHKNQVA